MLKILIAEDEDIIRKGLAYTIDWLAMGCVIAGEASNGIEGEEKILELKPDIVIADIMMPRQNGIEMIRKTKDLVKFKSIILTSYAEFEYAKQAIDLKVSEYLLKPVAEEQLIASVQKIKDEIEREKENNIIRQQNENVKIEINEFVDMAKSENPHVQRAIDVIKTRYTDKLMIEDVADEIGVSASYLSRKFKSVTGLTFLDFLNKYRIQQAIILLSTGKYRVYEVSDMTGFTDYKHFSSVFRRYTDKSPTEFTKLRDI